MEDFSFSSFKVSSIDKFLKEQYAIDVKEFLIAFLSFMNGVEFVANDLNLPTVCINICQNTVIISINLDNCSEPYCKVLRRRLGMNGLDILPLLNKYSVLKNKVIFYVESKMW